MQEVIREIKKGDYTNFLTLLEKFNPLIYNWLYKIKANKNNREDFYSSAKIILLESVKSFDENKGVPFPSYYKIKLYNWYGNQIAKDKKTVALYIKEYDGVENINFDKNLFTEEKILLIKNKSQNLTAQEQKILDKLLKSQSEKDIAKDLGLSKKTILNKKYIIIAKLKKILVNE